MSIPPPISWGLCLAMGFAGGYFVPHWRQPPEMLLPAVAATDSTDPDIETLLSLQRRLAAALAPLDSVAIDTILATDMRAINAGNQVLSKPVAMEALRQLRASLVHVEDDSIEVRRYGPVALMTLRETVTFKVGTARSASRIRMTEIWLKRGHRWQGVGSQATSIH